MHKISGVFSAALTPVKNDLSINKDLYLRHCQYLMRQGHDGLAIFGTTGEANSFSVQEKKDHLDFLVSNRIDPKILMPGTGSSSLNEAIDMTKHAAACLVMSIASFKEEEPVPGIRILGSIRFETRKSR